MNKKMRIGITCPYDLFRGGGVQEVVLALQKELSKRGHYAKILTPLPKGYTGEVADSVITIGTSRTSTAFSGTSWQWSFTVDTKSIDEVFAREKFDILHLHEPWMPVWSQQLIQRSDAAKVATLHSYFFDSMTAKTIHTVVTPYTKPLIKYFDIFTAVSKPATNYFRTLSKRPVTIIPNGIELAKYRARPATAVKHPSCKTILYVGRLEERKGIKYLLRAFNELSRKRKDVQLLLVGDGPDEKKLRDYIAELSIPRVTFLGYLSDEEKIHQLHKADVFCSPPTTDESFGIVLLEAMAADCPVVAGDNAGYQSVMKDTGAISLVNPRDTIDFARRLELMLFNEDLRKLWLKWARNYVKQYDYPKVVDQYLESYKVALEHHGKKTRS